MSAIEFQPWPKIARLNRDITITEKIDGTNAAVVIVAFLRDRELFRVDENRIAIIGDADSTLEFHVYAQSRTRFITPKQDNYGFAGWVQRNADALVATLGQGTHYGEWWGAGMPMRKYGLTGADKRFSLFNTKRWAPYDGWASNPPSEELLEFGIPGLGVVPVLYEGPFSQRVIAQALMDLDFNGSQAVRGFMKPEGVVIFHHASRDMFKVTLEGDEAPKGVARHANDEERIAA